MKKIGILTFHRAMNYGAILQVYALQKKIGNNCVVLDYRNQDTFEKDYTLNFFKKKGLKNKIKCFMKWIILPKSNYKLYIKGKKLRKFLETNIECSPILNKQNVAEFVKNNIKTVVVGSDQVWNMGLSNYDYTYVLDFCEEHEKKVSYAASFGGYKNFNENMLQCLKNFNSVTVREKEGVDLLAEIGVESKVVLDPTFLHEKSFWENFSKDVAVPKEKYVLIYTVAKQTNLYREAVEYAKNHNCAIYSLSEIKKSFFKYKGVFNSSAEEFIGYVKNAECVFTTSFHGMALSINLNKEFYYELSKEKINNNSRIIHIAETLGLESREIKNNKNINKESIEWEKVNDKLKELRTQSAEILEEMLKDE